MSTSTLTTWASRAGSAAVAGVAGYASYRHITHVALMAGESHEVAMVYPLAIDGLIVVGTVAMLADKSANRYPRLSARFALGFGIVATLAANVASAQPTVLARLVAAVPAVAFLIAVEVLSRTGKLKPAEITDTTAAAESPTYTQPSPAVARRLVPVDRASAAEPMRHAAQAPAAARKPRSSRRAPAAPVRRSPAETRALADAIAAANPGLPRAHIAAQLGLSDRRLREIYAATTPTTTADVGTPHLAAVAA
ncbi:DUF2637 domain-containing protein [Catellatospora chokoriensis]|uniref:DUF2637 domain-containing protein n=1 Tax=Catellatospora chokoriensis TaxID=310353 RepID=A0A8J3K6Y0_9ACTN|nr:DUF2637 domain-containing protein [Catellatospora chokoriensis]GIF91383.1 hypothetical protein Cch02nite_48270 [Catellatospora chokoriensis]